MRFALICAGLWVAGCGGQGTVTFQIEAPDPMGGLSPLADPRRDSISVTDERTATSLGTAVTAVGAGGRTGIGSIPVGTYDLRMSITGGGQLLGLARSRGVTVAPGIDQLVTLHVRKPIAYFGTAGSLHRPGNPPLATIFPVAAQLMAIDTTLPSVVELPSIPLPPGGLASATVSTSDGRFIIVGSRDKLFLLDSENYANAQTAVLMNPQGFPGMPLIRDLEISPDDKKLAVVTDQGLALLGDLTQFSGAKLQIVSAQQFTRLAFSPDSASAVLLSGMQWSNVDCAKGGASYYATVDVASGTIGPPLPVLNEALQPAIATDVRQDAAGRLLFAEPCAGGVLAHGSNGWTVAIPGSRIFTVAGVGNRFFGLQGSYKSVPVDYDPDEPMNRGVTLPFGQISDGSGQPPTLYRLSSDRILVPVVPTDPNQGLVQIRLLPSSQVVYQADATPDGAHVVFANRVRYQTSGTQYARAVSDMNVLLSYCTIDVTSDVYHLAEVDTATGNVGYQVQKGVDRHDCVTHCFDCFRNFACANDPTCTAPQCQTDTACNFADGFVPSGVSILMGGR